MKSILDWISELRLITSSWTPTLVWDLLSFDHLPPVLPSNSLLECPSVWLRDSVTVSCPVATLYERKEERRKLLIFYQYWASSFQEERIDSFQKYDVSPHQWLLPPPVQCTVDTRDSGVLLLPSGPESISTPPQVPALSTTLYSSFQLREWLWAATNEIRYIIY